MVATQMSLHLLEFAPRDAAGAIALERRRRGELRATPGLLRHRPIATSDLVVVTPRRLGLLCAWTDRTSLEAFLAGSGLLAELRARARRSSTLRLEPVRVSGTWGGVGFDTSAAAPLADDEPLLALVHARLVPRRAAHFLRENLRIARWARGLDGYLGGMGVHEGPRRFGSLSRWDSVAAMQRFAYAPGVHQPILRPAHELPLSEDFFVARLRALEPPDLLER